MCSNYYRNEGAELQVGICDDQEETRELIADKVKFACPEADIILYKSGQEVLDALMLPDILFLDIQMPGIDGMQTARELRRINSKVIIIFVTVTGDYVFQSFDVGAFHYLVKPFDDAKFKEVLQNAERQYRELELPVTNIKKELPPLIITTNGGHIPVNFEDIVYAEVFDRKILLHTMDSDIEYYGKMKDLEKMAGDGFYRPHRAYLINFDYISKYNSSVIYLKRGQALMAKQKYKDFVQCYLRYNHRKGNR